MATTPPPPSAPVLSVTAELEALRTPFWRAQKMTAALVTLLRQQFADLRNIQSPSLRVSDQHYLWTPDDTTDYLIEAIGRWRPQLTEKRLAAIVRRNGQKVLRLGINDQLMMAFPPSTKSREELFATYIQGSHTIFCLGKESAETEIFSAEIAHNLIEFGPKLRASLCLHKFLVVEIGELTLLEESAQHYVVPVTVAYTYEERWKIDTLSSAPLRQVIPTITTT